MLSSFESSVKTGLRVEVGMLERYREVSSDYETVLVPHVH